MARKKRSDIGKRKGGLWGRLKNWAAGELPESLDQAQRKHGLGGYSAAISQLPEKLDDTPLSGDRYVNGVCCRTVGEYKTAVANDPDMGGWHG